jgi:hypothetical protein
MSAQATGGWLIGFGALVVFAVGLLAAGRPRLHLFEGRGDKRRDRLSFAVGTTGLLSGAVGSVVLAVAAAPAPRLVFVTALGAAALVYCFLAVRVHQLWVQHATEAGQAFRHDQGNKRAQWEVECALRCARWRWALAHPFTATSAEDWPDAWAVPRIGERPPRRFPEADFATYAKLTSCDPNIAEVHADLLPVALRDVVQDATAAGFDVLQTQCHLLFYPPSSNERPISCPFHQRSGIVQNLRRKRLLRRMAHHGLPAGRTPRPRLHAFR